MGSLRDPFSHPRDQVVECFNRGYKHNYTTPSGGNISMVDAEGWLWISPRGIDKGTLTREQVCYTDLNSSGKWEGLPSMEWPLHAIIYQQRNDVKALIHAHPPGLVTFAVAKLLPEIHVLAQVGQVCKDIGFASYALPGSSKLAENVRCAFSRAEVNCVVMESHGVMVAAPDMATAYKRFETLEFCCRALLKVSPAMRQIKVLSTQRRLFD